MSLVDTRCGDIDVVLLGDILVEVGMAKNDPHRQVCSTVVVKTRSLFTCLVKTRGTYVKITLPGKQHTLVLCQVEIFGHPGMYRRIMTGRQTVTLISMLLY